MSQRAVSLWKHKETASWLAASQKKNKTFKGKKARRTGGLSISQKVLSKGKGKISKCGQADQRERKKEKEKKARLNY
jgi:hypothetical protein